MVIKVPICLEMESEILVVIKPKGQKLAKKLIYNIKNLSRTVQTKNTFRYPILLQRQSFLAVFWLHCVKSTQTLNTSQRERVIMYVLACRPTLGQDKLRVVLVSYYRLLDTNQSHLERRPQFRNFLHHIFMKTCLWANFLINV